jgi:hypothetical protein
MLPDITRQTPLLPQTSSETERNNLIDASDSARTLRNFSAACIVAFSQVGASCCQPLQAYGRCLIQAWLSAAGDQQFQHTVQLSSHLQHGTKQLPGPCNCCVL